MSNELTNTRDHLKRVTIDLYESIVLRNYVAAEDYAATIVTLIHHIKRLEGLDNR